MWLAEQKRKEDEAAAEALERVRADFEAARAFQVEPEEGIERLESSYGDETRDLIALVCNELRDFLISKNEQYGNSAIEPVRIFSRASTVEQLYVRIDDKLSRLARGDDRLESDADVVDDLIGYLILLKVARRRDADA